MPNDVCLIPVGFSIQNHLRMPACFHFQKNHKMQTSLWSGDAGISTPYFFFLNFDPLDAKAQVQPLTPEWHFTLQEALHSLTRLCMKLAELTLQTLSRIGEATAGLGPPAPHKALVITYQYLKSVQCWISSGPQNYLGESCHAHVTDAEKGSQSQ